MNKTLIFVSILVGISTLIGAGFALDSRWHQEEKVVVIAKNLASSQNRLSNHIISDQAVDIQKRMWSLKDRHGEDPTKFPISAKEEYRNLKEKYKSLQKDLDRIKEYQMRMEKGKVR